MLLVQPSRARVVPTLERRWTILAILFVARFASGFQLQSVASVGPFLIADLELNYQQFGTLVGLFMLPGLAVALPAGFLAKLCSDKQVVIAALAFMVTGGVLSGASASHGLVGVGRILSGAGASVLAVTMTKMITDWFVTKELFIGMSIFIVGWPVGIAAGQAFQPHIAQEFGWAVVFHITAIMSAVALMLILLFYRAAPTETKDLSTARRPLSRKEIGLVCIAGWIWTLSSCAYVVMLSFGPVLLSERGISIVDASRIVSLMSWAFLFALPLGGYLATRFIRPNTVVMIGLFGSVFSGLAISMASHPIVAFTAFGIGSAVAVAVIATLPSEVLRPESRAVGLGIYYSWCYGGMTLAPPIGGLLRDVTQTAAAPIYFATAMTLACVCLLGVFRAQQSRCSRASL